MKKTSFGLVFNTIMFGMCALYIYWLSKKNNNEQKTEKQLEVKGTVTRMFMPEMQKRYHIFFAGGKEYLSPFLASNEKIDIGDSIYKQADEEWFIIYRNGNASDSLVFFGAFGRP